MFFFQRRRTANRHPALEHGRGRFRPNLETLEDRALPSGSPWFGWFSPPSPGPVTHLQVVVPTNTKIGVPASIEVVALDAANHRVPSYTGIVHFTSTDGGATLPADYTFTASDHGSKHFDVTMATLGSQTITATDTVTATITGSAATTVNPAPVATHFQVQTLSTSYLGQLVPVRVVALDASNHVVPNYVGTVHLTSGDAAATLPATDYTFVAGDKGRHTFNVTFGTLGPQTVTATDTATATITGIATSTVNTPLVATHFAVIASHRVAAGNAFQVAVVALDASNKLVPTYTGTVHFTSTDVAATGVTLPTDAAFTPADEGIKLFSVTWRLWGNRK